MEIFASGLASVCQKEFGIDALLETIDRHFSSNAKIDFHQDLNQMADFLQIPYSIAKEIMDLAGSRGLVCTDETIAATKFYANLILTENNKYL